MKIERASNRWSEELLFSGTTKEASRTEGDINSNSWNNKARSVHTICRVIVREKVREYLIMSNICTCNKRVSIESVLIDNN